MSILEVVLVSSWYAVQMGKNCEFCYGAKGWCKLFEDMKSCTGVLSMRPKWCPIYKLKGVPLVKPESTNEAT